MELAAFGFFIDGRGEFISGDFITALLVGGTGSSFIGNVVYENVGVAGNIPFAAAFAVVPVVIMGVYLLGAKRLGAFEAM